MEISTIETQWLIQSRSSKALREFNERNTAADADKKDRALIAPDMSTPETSTEADRSQDGVKQRQRCLE
jgi:hypothetical protein